MTLKILEQVKSDQRYHYIVIMDDRVNMCSFLICSQFNPPDLKYARCACHGCSCDDCMYHTIGRERMPVAYQMHISDDFDRESVPRDVVDNLLFVIKSDVSLEEKMIDILDILKEYIDIE